MSARSDEYRVIIENLVRHIALLDEEEKAQLAAMLSTAESQVLAKMAEVYPDG